MSDKLNFSKKEIFSIPNIIGYIRILLIPIFMYFYIMADSQSDYYIAYAIVLFSVISDFFDGLIARKFNMVTELGKFIDPLSDKLTQLALLICVVTQYKIVVVLLIIFFIKEFTLSLISLIVLIKVKKKLDGALMHGKISTAILDISMFILFMFVNLHPVIVISLISVSAISIIVTISLYLPLLLKMGTK